MAHETTPEQKQAQYGIKPRPKALELRQVEALEKIAAQLEALNRHIEYISVNMPTAD